MLQLIGGVLWLNLVFVGVGYAVLAAFLRGRSVAGWGSFAGVALLVGAGLVGVVLSWLVVLGLPSSLPVFVATAGVMIGLGLAGARLSDRVAIATSPARALPRSSLGRWIAAAAAGAILGVCGVVLVAGFRSSPWLDDAWAFWLPKGVELSRAGLNPKLFVPNADYITFTSADYPVWWSLIGGLDVAAVGRIDLRAVNAEIAVLYGAFAAAALRLLWGHVRKVILLPGLLLAISAPELVAQTESGGADLPLAFAFALAVVAAVVWLQRGEPLLLLLAFVFSATALNTKNEALGLVPVWLVIGGCFAWLQWPRRYLMLIGAVAAAFLTLAPWLVWTHSHGVTSAAIGVDAFNPAHLWHARDRLEPALRSVGHELLYPRGWFLAIPLLTVTSLALVIRDRRVAWLAPPIIVLSGFAYLVWIYWAGSIELRFWLDTSAYRTVDSVVLAAAVTLPVVAERLAGNPRGG
jgi:hypothetical protein